jgi:hypothetical protein
MIGTILQALVQQVGPQVTQFLNSPALPQLVNSLQRIPLVYWVRGAQAVSTEVSGWYESLSPEAKQRLQDAAAWAIKDLSVDLLSMAATAAAGGIPVGPVIELLINKVLEKEGHEQNVSEQEKAFIRLELQRQLQNRIK